MWIIAVCETPLFSSLEPRQANHSFDEVVNPEIGRDSHRQRYAYRHHATSADTLRLSIMYSMFSYLHRGLFLNHVVPTSGLPQRVVFLMSEPERADFDKPWPVVRALIPAALRPKVALVPTVVHEVNR